MKKIQIRNSVVATVVALGLFVTAAYAQRRGGGEGGSFHGGSISGGGGHYSLPSTNGGNINRPQVSNNGGNNSVFLPRVNGNINNNIVRPQVSYNNGTNAGRFYNRTDAHSNFEGGHGFPDRGSDRYNNNRNEGRSAGTFNGGHNEGSYMSRGGYPVRYSGGYGHHGYGYRGCGINVFSPYGLYPFYPTLGLRLGWLPFGYYDFYWDGYPYYYYNSVFYRRTVDNQYEIVSPPVGAKVNSIPSDAKVVVINGNKYYECNGTYYQEQLDANNKVVYIVIGTNGVLNQPSTPQVVQEPEVGDIYPQLPPNCTAIYLNGQKYYETPDHVYYQEILENGQTNYKIVGK